MKSVCFFSITLSDNIVDQTNPKAPKRFVWHSVCIGFSSRCMESVEDSEIVQELVLAPAELSLYRFY